MNKPLIGISASARYRSGDECDLGALTLSANYVQGVLDAGGYPIVLAPRTEVDQILPMLDGWLIPGGDDIDPAEYGREPHPKTSRIDPERFAFESALFEVAPIDLPILGICYGCQFVNVRHGGTLNQHVPDLVGHELHAGGTLAPYRLTPGSKLQAILGGETAEGRSYHHQSVDAVGAGLLVSARHEDGTVEAVEAVDQPWVIAPQWHPERTLDSEPSKRLFRAFVQAAEAYRLRRGVTLCR